VKRPIIYKSWCPVPDHILDVFDAFTAPEMRLCRAILKLSRGRMMTVPVTNTRLKELAGLDRNSLPYARRGLVQRGIIAAAKAGKESYRYEILDPPIAETVKSKELPVFCTHSEARVIPQDELLRLLSPAPALGVTPAPIAAASVITAPAPAVVPFRQRDMIPLPASARPTLSGDWVPSTRKKPTTPPATPAPPVATRPVISAELYAKGRRAEITGKQPFDPCISHQPDE